MSTAKIDRDVVTPMRRPSAWRYAPPRRQVTPSISRLLRQSVLSGLILAVTLGAEVAAAGPDSGYRDIQDFAQASFQTRLDDCLFVDATVRYFAGDNLQDPIGSGQPGSWADAPITIQVFDSCAEDAEVLRLEGVGFPADGPAFERLETAVLDVGAVTLSDGQSTSVDAEIHLVWTANGDATVVIGHDLDSGYFRQERSRSAIVTGTVSFDTSPYWSELALASDDAHDVSIGTANEIAIP